MLVALASCPGTPKSVAGRTRDTAIPVSIARSPIEIDVESPNTTPPHWYRVTLSQTSYLTVSVPEFEAGAFTAEVIGDDGTPLSDVDPITGSVLVRVTGDTQRYRLHLRARPGTRAEVVHERCDPNRLDPTNPNCEGVSVCDHNKPDFGNPSCCSMVCLRGPCAFEIVAIDQEPDRVFGWIDGGATGGVVRGAHGYAEVPGRDGKLVRVAVTVLAVEPERSKILVGGSVDAARIMGSLVRLEMPNACGGNATRPR